MIMVFCYMVIHDLSGVPPFICPSCWLLYSRIEVILVLLLITDAACQVYNVVSSAQNCLGLVFCQKLKSSYY